MDRKLALEQIKALTEKYQEIVRTGRITKYNEEMTKKDFILPLFEALGWKTADSEEVSAEEQISKTRVDYGFRINGIPKFFLEAKSFREDLDNRKFVEQAINYSWHKGCTWAILTNFEGLRIFNAEVKTPNIWMSQLKPTLHCSEFIAKFDELYLLSRESFENRLLDSEAEKWGKKAKKTPIDKQLLADFTNFRTLLSKNITKLNSSKHITEQELDESVQRILDRLMFIRNCEDRELEPKTLIANYREWESKGKGHLIKSLRATFLNFDDKYNSKIFAKHLCDELEIDNEVLHEVIEGLYTTKDNEAYDFSIIDADVLGTIYEQYLGHILRKTEKTAKVTENHAHRKEQGIYYTPPYIVNYIVRNTLGKILNGKKVDVEHLRVLDPACGSGSFLIKAFDVLNEYYKENDNDYKQTQLDLESGIPFKTKSKILQNNIFGVDLDKQAVEIAQLNLLLKITEKGHRLPLLEKNIKRGNSLIDEEEMGGSVALNWYKEYKTVMDEGGFDVVIGNPPYISNWQLSETNRELVLFLDEKYSSVTLGHWDIYILFIKKALELLKDNGFLSFIVPSSFAKEKYGRNLREIIIKENTIISLAEFGTESVFKNVARKYIIFVIQKKKPNNNTKTEIVYFKNLKFERSHNISQKSFLSFHNFTFRTDLDDAQSFILDKISSGTPRIGNICCVNVGVVAHSKEGSSIAFKKNDVIHTEHKGSYKKYIEGKDISRYSYSWKGLYMDYDSKVKCFHRPKFQELFDSNKIIVRRVSGENNSIVSVYDDTHFYMNDNLISIIPWNDDILKLQSPEKKWTIFKPYNYFSLKYILGILNSKLISFYFNKSIATGTLQGTYSGVYPEDVRAIPIKEISERQQEPIIVLVDKIQLLNKRLNDLGHKITDERANLEKEILETDKQINQIVYNLYEITEAEKKVIEDNLT